MDVETLLTTTRSVRRKLDLDRPVEPEVITDCLRIAMQAPIASALLPSLRWLVIRDPAIRAKIAAPVREAGYESQAKYGHLVDEKSLASGRHLLDVLDRVPVLVVLCLGGRPGSDPAFANAFYGSAYPALWSFQLALRSRGLGSTFVGYHLASREQEVAESLCIPEDVTQITLLPVAYTTTTEFRPAARPPVDEITYYDRWNR
jgi:nitroreductase